MKSWIVPTRASTPRSFTLTELLAVIAIMAVIGTISIISVRAVAREARLSTGINTVKAVLDNARAIALRDNTVTLVVFRARLTDPETNDFQIEAVTATWKGDSYAVSDDCNPLNDVYYLVDRFVKIEDAPVRLLPSGIAVAAPLYQGEMDNQWVTTTNLKGTALLAPEAAGAVIGVMYAPDGTTITRNPATDADRVFVDFDEGFSAASYAYQRRNGIDIPACNPVLTEAWCDFGDDINGNAMTGFFCQDVPDDEPYVWLAPFIALFDEEQARELYDTSGWNIGLTRVAELSEFINDNADRIHFNRYTGVVMK